MLNMQNSLTCGSGSKRYPIATITNRTTIEERLPAIWTKEDRNYFKCPQRAVLLISLPLSCFPQGWLFKWLLIPPTHFTHSGCCVAFSPGPNLKHGKLQLFLLAHAEKSGSLVKLQMLALELQKADWVWLKIWVYIPVFSHRCFPEQDSETLSKWLKSFGKTTPQSCIFPKQ